MVAVKKVLYINFHTYFQPPPEAQQLYDAVMLYAYGLNKTLSKGYSVTNGSDIIQNILNTRHESKDSLLNTYYPFTTYLDT